MSLDSGYQKVGVLSARNLHSSIICKTQENYEALRVQLGEVWSNVSGLENLLGTGNPVLHFPSEVSLHIPSLC